MSISSSLPAQQAQPSPASAAMTGSAAFSPRHGGREAHRLPKMRSPAISQRVTRRGLILTTVLIFVVAVAAAYLAAHGWSHTAQQAIHTLGHLPKPLRTLIGGAHLR